MGKKSSSKKARRKEQAQRAALLGAQQAAVAAQRGRAAQMVYFDEAREPDYAGLDWRAMTRDGQYVFTDPSIMAEQERKEIRPWSQPDPNWVPDFPVATCNGRQSMLLLAIQHAPVLATQSGGLIAEPALFPEHPFFTGEFFVPLKEAVKLFRQAYPATRWRQRDDADICEPAAQAIEWAEAKSRPPAMEVDSNHSGRYFVPGIGSAIWAAPALFMYQPVGLGTHYQFAYGQCQLALSETVGCRLTGHEEASWYTRATGRFAGLCQVATTPPSSLISHFMAHSDTSFRGTVRWREVADGCALAFRDLWLSTARAFHMGSLCGRRPHAIAGQLYPSQLGLANYWWKCLDEQVNVPSEYLRPAGRDLFARWKTSDVVGLVKTIVDDKRLEVLPILRDALMDAGCEDEGLLHLCRPIEPILSTPPEHLPANLRQHPAVEIPRETGYRWFLEFLHTPASLKHLVERARQQHAITSSLPA